MKNKIDAIFQIAESLVDELSASLNQSDFPENRKDILKRIELLKKSTEEKLTSQFERSVQRIVKDNIRIHKI